MFARIHDYLKKQSRPSLLTGGIIAVLLVGFFDYITGREFTFSIFYLLPICLVAWYAGRSAAFFLSMAGSALEFAVNSVSGRAYSLISFWNGIVLFGFFLISVMILSALKKEYEKRMRLIDELEKIIGELDAAKGELEKKSQDLARSNAELQLFASVVSHDLQEPLVAIMSSLKLLERRFEGALDRDTGQIIAHAAHRSAQMQRLIKNLLAYSRAGRQEKDFAIVACEDVLAQALENLSSVIDARGAVITSDHLPEIMGDFTQLVQVFQNLISNAIKFCDKPPPRVHVSAERGEKEWTFSFRDNGVGIPSEHVERIFDFFHRVHSEGEYPGTGIGLSTCKKIVQRHRGRIWVETEYGSGSTFYFTIPD